ncbi:MAG: PDZ domain-containing protein [Bacteroidota bacterium]
MHKITFTRLFIFLLFVGFSSSFQAQKKTKITIKKSQNGKTETIKKEFEGDNAELTEFLREMGIDIDVDNGNDVMEIIIDQKNFDEEKLSEWSENLLSEIESKRSKSAFLGIRMNDAEEGVHIKEVIENSPAEEIGLLAGDILTSIDGKEIDSTNDVIDIISSYQAGDEVKLRIEREGKTKNFKAELAEKDENYFSFFNGSNDMRFNFEQDEDGGHNVWYFEDEDSENRPFLGVTNGGSTEINGASIGTVTSGSTAEVMGIQSGDVITSFNGKAVEDWGSLVAVIEESEVGEAITLELERDGETFMLSGEMQSRSDAGQVNIFNWDELGGLNFNFDCKKNNFDSEELEESMERLGIELQEKLQGLEGLEELENLDFDFDFDFDGDHPFTESMTVIVLVEELTQEECDKVNENAEHRITPDNNLGLTDVNFFPNPNNGLFNLNFETPNNGDLTVNIYDQNGRTVYKEMLAEFEGEYNNRIDISERANGTYYLQIIQNNKTYNKKILKQ